MAAQCKPEVTGNPFIDGKWLEDLDATPFLVKCRSGRATRRELESYLVQQYFYSRHFTRYLCALLSNIEKEEDRLALTMNLVDEIGLGETKGEPHSVLYRRMLDALGIDPSLYRPTPETQGLIDLMLESCQDRDIAVGLGAICLGAEAIVPHVYAQIVRGFEALGMPKENLHFFYLHIDCDDEHAETMQQILHKEIRDETEVLALRNSAARTIAARRRFFEAISPSVEAIKREEIHAAV